MKRMLKKTGRRAVALLLCVCLAASASGLSVSAADKPVTGGPGTALVSDLCKSMKTVCLNKLVSWTLDGFMNAMFEPEDSAEVKLLKDIQEQLGTVLANQQKISDELKGLEGLVEVQSYLEIVNDYMDALALCEPFFQCYDTLNKLDKTYENQPDALKAERLRALTDGLGIGTMTSASTSVDDKFLTLYSKFAGPIAYSVNKQVISDGDLFDVYREIKRYQYCFENEAWDEMEAFFDYAAYSFAVVSLVETASVQARIERCRIHNEGLAVTDPSYWSTASLETWLYNEGGTAAESDLESHIARGAAVYDEHPVVRQDIYRHFWKPGYELLLYTTVNSLGSHPVDEPLAGKGGTSAGSNFSKTAGMRIKREGEKAKPVDEFWDTFYQSDLYAKDDLLTTEAVNKMLTACGHNMTLAEILDKGDFTFVNADGTKDVLGFVLKKDDASNPMKIDESHNGTWVEGLGTVYTDKIRVYTRYAPATQVNDIGSNKASNYKTYYYYHTSDGSTRWYVKDEYTAGSLAQVYVCSDACLHNGLRLDESSAVEPTCTAEGKMADYRCADCGKVFAGKTLPMIPHADASWQHDSTKHWKHCDVCDRDYDVGAHVCTDGMSALTGIYICRDCGYMTMITPLVGWVMDVPKTGVDENIPALIFALSLGGAVFCIARKRKKENTR